MKMYNGQAHLHISHCLVYLKQILLLVSDAREKEANHHEVERRGYHRAVQINHWKLCTDKVFLVHAFNKLHAAVREVQRAAKQIK